MFSMYYWILQETQQIVGKRLSEEHLQCSVYYNDTKIFFKTLYRRNLKSQFVSFWK